MNYYNEWDPYAAQWLENLIHAGHIPFGIVDRRSVLDVAPRDLAGFTQCHFFAGIGGWSLALRLAGVPDDLPLWTASCPCQPFSAAGAGLGVLDERHLWPALRWLVEQRRPTIVLGEQVASASVVGRAVAGRKADAWLDVVFSDLERARYACGAADLPSAGVGAPHIRQRLHWVAYSDDHEPRIGREPAGEAGILGHRDRPGRSQLGRGPGEPVAPLDAGPAEADGAVRLGNPPRTRPQERDGGAVRGPEAGQGGRGRGDDALAPGTAAGAGPLDGVWRAADWLLCRDGRWRPVEPGTLPLAHRVPGRVGRLRAYGNAINPHLAAEFIKAALSP